VARSECHKKAHKHERERDWLTRLVTVAGAGSEFAGVFLAAAWALVRGATAGC
jgi:hypothetical protein